jgi:hypothetical protein
MTVAGYRLWVNDDRTVAIRVWPNGRAEMAKRKIPQLPWRPWVVLREEELHA